MLRRVSRAFASFFLFNLAIASIASAQMGPGSQVTDDIDYLTRQGVDSRLLPDDVDLLGDHIDFNTGAVVFNHTDVSLPGNSGLEVAVRRRKTVGEMRVETKVAFRDWSLEYPRIAMLIGTPSSVLNPTEKWKTNRCTGAASPGPITQQSQTFQAWEYWNGLNLEIPGQGSRTVLDSTTGSQWPAGTVKGTSDNWALKCIANIGVANGGGEGFVAVAPNGDQYRLDLLFHRPARTFNRYLNGHLYRRLAVLAATEVTDVDGNWVRFVYNSEGQPTRIHSNDGRIIDIAYHATEPWRALTVTANGRTWTYTAITGGLETVTLPDGRAWNINLPNMNLRGGKDGQECPPLPVTGTITHPNGAVGTYTFDEIRHGRTYTPSAGTINRGPRATVCGYSHQIIPSYFKSMSLVQKSLAGPGYPSATWSLSYSGDAGAYGGSGGLPDTKWTQVIDPLGRKAVYFYDRRWGALAGAMTREELYETASAPSPMQVIDYSYTIESAVGVFDMLNENVATHTQPRHPYVTNIARSSDTFHTRNTHDTTQSSVNYSYGFPTLVETWSSVSPIARTDEIVYAHNKTKWILGLPSSVTKNGVLFDSYQYDTLGHRIEDRKFGAVARTFGYHTLAGQAGALAWVDDALARRTQFISYKRGLPQQVIRKDGISVYRTVDDNGWVTNETNGRGFLTAYQYTPVGRLSLIDRPSPWADTSIAYTGLGGAFQQTLTRGNSRIVNYFDALTRLYLVKREDVTGVVPPVFLRTDYNAFGLATYQSFPSAAATATSGKTISYDGLLRLLTEVENVSPFATTTHQYLAGNRHKVIDPSGASVTTQLNAYGTPAIGQPVEIVDAMGAVTNFSRDVFGKIVQINQTGTQNGYTTSVTRDFWYDGRQRLCRHRAPEIGDELFSYDVLDRLEYSQSGQPAGSGCITPAGDRIARVYDALDRQTLMDYPAGTTDVGTQYDNNGNITRIERGSIVWTYGYNELDLMTGEQAVVDGRTYAFGYGYNTEGALSSRSSPSGSTFNLMPDALGRPTKVSVGAANYISGGTYHPNHLLESATLASGQLMTQTLTARQAPYEIRSQKLGGALALHLLHGYDLRGKVSSITDLAQANNDRSLAYDANGRLLTASGPWGAGAFVYDASGNMRSQTLGSRSIAITYSSATNRVATATDSAGGGTRTYTYDARGNTSSDGLRIFIYDHANQPTSVTMGSTSTYTYDGSRKRIKAVSGGKTVYTLYSALSGALIYRDEATDNRRTDYLSIGPLGLRFVNGSPSYTHADHLGSPVAQTDSVGNVVWRERYTPYGEKVDDPVPNRNDTGFTGHIQDDATRLTYAKARYYDPVIARFLSTDPIGYQDGLNLYQYARNDPLNLVDPDGTEVGAAYRSVYLADGGSLTSPPHSPKDNFAQAMGAGLMVLAGFTAIGGAYDTTVGVLRGDAASIGEVVVDVASKRIDAVRDAVGTITRYMGADEAKIVSETGEIPNFGRDRTPRPTHVTTDKPLDDAAEAKQVYELSALPTHRATVPRDRVKELEPTPDGRSTTSGGGSQVATPLPIPVLSGELHPLDRS